jgi:tRNA pseudouridine32 synthase / 23S rRNA pseudouridine746 synthase
LGHVAYVDLTKPLWESESTYWYIGQCPLSGQELRLPRTLQIEHLAQQWMTEMATDAQFQQEGKMYGLLLAKSVTGEIHTLKAFSGLWQGQSTVAGWVPPLPGRETLGIAEIDTIQKLSALRDQISIAKNSPIHQEYAALLAESQQQRDQLNTELQERRSYRQQQRNVAQLPTDLVAIEQASKADSRRKRECKERWHSRLEPLKLEVDRLNTEIRHLKQQRQTLSQTLQTQLHQATIITNFAGETKSLQNIRPTGLPTGSGECCAPKLLHYAASNQLIPLAMAEFWWGEAVGDKQPGVFYAACADRCQPLMGFMLSGLAAEVQRRIPIKKLEIIYEDHDMVAIDKPHNLLSVPGRYGQPNAQQSLEQQLATKLYPAHRLDQDTSGVLLFAKNLATYHWVAKQFVERRVQKIYQAVLVGSVLVDEGVIELPLAADLDQRPRQKVDREFGKPCVTEFRVMQRQENLTWVELRPLTGRTHQLRVHMAIGLQAAILGDRLYGNNGIIDGITTQSGTKNSRKDPHPPTPSPKPGEGEPECKAENRLYLHAQTLILPRRDAENAEVRIVSQSDLHSTRQVTF